MKRVKIIRVLEYTGDDAWIRQTMSKNQVQHQKWCGAQNYIHDITDCRDFWHRVVVAISVLVGSMRFTGEVGDGDGDTSNSEPAA